MTISYKTVREAAENSHQVIVGFGAAFVEAHATLEKIAQMSKEPEVLMAIIAYGDRLQEISSDLATDENEH